MHFWEKLTFLWEMVTYLLPITFHVAWKMPNPCKFWQIAHPFIILKGKSMVITWENVVASAEKYKKKEYYNKIKKTWYWLVLHELYNVMVLQWTLLHGCIPSSGTNENQNVALPACQLYNIQCIYCITLHFKELLTKQTIYIPHCNTILQIT